MLDCQDALKDYDPVFLSRSKKNLTEICNRMEESCATSATEYYHGGVKDLRGWFDIGHPAADPFPPPYIYGYLMEESVLQALGVPVNHSSGSESVSRDFIGTFDIVHGGFRDAIAYLLDSGVKVHMMYGDRDYACNWIGGEKASLAIPYSRAEEFGDAGYTPLVTPEGIRGQTRQLGNYSFTRVYQSGHEVPAYQPVAAYEIFMRATFDRDIATGLIPVTDALTTIGPKDTWHIKNAPPSKPTPRCNILKPNSCSPEIWEKVMAGDVVVKDYFVVEDDADELSLTLDDAQTVLGDL